MLSSDEIKNTQAAFSGGPVKPVTLSDIMRECCDLFGYTREQIRSPSRAPRLTHARHWFMYHAHLHGYWSLSRIANYAGRTNHATVLYAVREFPKKQERIKEMLECRSRA